MPEKVKTYSESLIPHAPILITDNADFKTLGFEGNGTETSPFLIKDLSIDSDEEDCIKIISTSVYFVIQNCELSSSDDEEGTGIYFEKVVNGAVIDCNIHSLTVGISALKSENCKFNTNTISGLQKGIYLTQSIRMSIKGNEISKSEYGIHLSKMDNSYVLTNNIDECNFGFLIGNSVEIRTWSNQITGSFFGLYFHNSIRCESFSNLISASRFGVYYAYSQQCNVTSSELIGNRYGVSLQDVDGGVISSNLVKFNSEYGIHLKESRDVEILSNTVFDNSGFGVYLKSVTGSSIHNNEIGFTTGANAADFVGTATKGLVNDWDTNAWSDFKGTSKYSIPGDRGSLDNDPHYILYVDSPSDVNIDAPASGTINWSASAFRPSYYSISLNLVVLEEGDWDGADITAVFAELNLGTYTFTLSLTTWSGITASDTVIVNVLDRTNPEWVQTPEDQVVECGDMLAYQLEASDYFGIARWWVNNTEFSIDDGLLQNINPLVYGVYNLEVRVYDPSDNYASYILSVTAPDSVTPYIDSPLDISFIDGETGQSIVWQVYDCNPLTYEIYRDGILVESGEWTHDMTIIQYSLDTLQPGAYVYTIYLVDIAGNSASDSVEVTVEEPAVTETPTTPTSPTEIETISTPTTTSGTDTSYPTGNGLNDMNTILFGVMGIGGVVVVLVLIVLKKR
jgi:parallel beta-helix repeat protein